MKSFIKIMLFSILFSSSIHAQESVTMLSAEYFGCKFSENKDMDDLTKFVNRWNDWMDDGDRNNYTANILLPIYKSPSDEIDFLWVGNTNTITEMAIGQSEYRSSKVVDSFPSDSCPYSMWARQMVVQDVNESEDWNWDEFVVAYHYCELKDGKTIDDAYNAQKEWIDYMNSIGDERGSRLVLPSHGSGPLMGDTDFVLLLAHGSLEKWGNNLDNGFIDRDERASFTRSETYSCKNPVLYTGTRVRAGK